jgi:putative NIF3 family GTP cyclohydrolase 1 type 2
MIWEAMLDPGVPAADFGCRLAALLQREPLHIPAGADVLRRVGWCSGAAQGLIEQAAASGLNAFVSGEISEQTVHLARELDIHYYAAGHHATECLGVRALGDHLAENFDLSHEFIDIPNPV